jgi:hypothetical protein
MSQIPVTLVPGNIPTGMCFASDQDRYNFFTQQTQAYLAGNIVGINIGNSEPSVNDRDKPWYKLNSDGSPALAYPYFFFGGQWLALNPERDPNIRRLYVGTLTQLLTYDGGENATLTQTTGPMWVEDTNFQFKIPMHPGTNTVTYDGNPATTLGVGAALGEERHILIQGELPALPLNVNLGHATADNNATQASGGLAAYNNAGTAPTTVNMGSGLSHQNLPPVYGIYMIMPSARLYYRGTS